MGFQVSLYLDTRRKKQDNTFPLKIRLWHNENKKAKLYPTNFDLTLDDFQKTWETDKPRKDNKELRLILNQVLAKAEKVASELKPFTFDAFERKLYRKSGEGENAFWFYDQISEGLKKREQIGTADLYRLSKNSISAFIEEKKGKAPSKLLFTEINKDFLKDYEIWMLDKGKSRTTVSIYLRCLRAAFNLAIADGEIDKELYPFGKRKYQMPATRNLKKAFTKAQLKVLFESSPEIPEQAEARDFWFFSYSSNGMNTKDIALLKYKHLKDSQLVFYRAKTINTSKHDLKPIQIYLNDFTKSVIEKYGNANVGPETYIFPIINDSMAPDEKHKKFKNFTKFINQHIKRLSKSLGLPEEISTYYARHSYATNAVRSGASLAFVQESLGHGSMKTTMNYFAGFDDNAKKEISDKLMEF